MLFQLFDSLRNFFAFTASYSNQVFKEPLTKEEEARCISKMQQGDKKARDELIEHNCATCCAYRKKI